MAAKSWNKVELMGNLTRDPELRYTPNGAAVVTFGLATNRSYLVDGERREEVDFHKLVAWNKLAELCNQLLKKGTRVFVSGRLHYRDWEGQDGVKRREAEITLDDMIIVTPKASGTTSDYTPTSKPQNIKEEAQSSDLSGQLSDESQSVVGEPETEELETDKPKAPSKEEKVSPDEDLPF